VNENSRPGLTFLHNQVGFLLRQAGQRHTALFAKTMIGDLTTMQFATLAALLEVGSCSQNELGRLSALDQATIKGIVDRLRGRGLVTSIEDPRDRRRIVITLTPAGREMGEKAIQLAQQVSAAALEPITPAEQKQLIKLLIKIS
jgi:DNA-binding MarR family transcriptional regulator